MTYDPASSGPPPGWSGGQPPYPGGGYGQQGGGWGPPPPGPGGPGGMRQESNPFAALFDFSFTRFATPGLVKLLYIVGTVLLGLAYAFFMISGFIQSVWVGLLVLVGGAILLLFYLALLRVSLEFYYAVTRMSEDIHHRR